MKVVKFGGTSMANADSIRQVADIVKSDPSRRVVVVSAPGKREKTDTKVTDLLYGCYQEKLDTGSCATALKAVKKRFEDIIEGLHMDYSLAAQFETIERDVEAGADKDYVASRGEFLSALVTARYLGYRFIDAAEMIRFDETGAFDSEKTNELCAAALSGGEGIVVPGFYGAMPDGTVKTFSRGGSDVTGSILSRAAGAELYENWTDVDGFMTCDPRIVKNPTIIDMLTYKELRELSYMGANVLHPDSIFPVRKCDIPINIKNTFNPAAKGTFIVPTKKYLRGEYERDSHTITGIAGKKNFCGIHVEKSMMNNELGFARRVLEVLEKHGVPLEHMPSGIDTLTVIFDEGAADAAELDSMIADMKRSCKPDNIEIMKGLALIAVVGHGMSRKKGTATKVCQSLYRADVNIRMIDQGSSELNIIVAVENADYERAIEALYNEFRA